jgi:hypothetical protein
MLLLSEARDALNCPECCAEQNVDVTEHPERATAVARLRTARCASGLPGACEGPALSPPPFNAAQWIRTEQLQQ